jgi:lysophospholipase L1-like esterase
MMKKYLANSALVLFSTLLGLLLIEIILRVYNPFDTRIRLGHIHLPANITYRIHIGGKAGLDDLVVDTRNKIGFRGPPLPNDNVRTLRVLTIGGSTTECFYLSDGKGWPALLYRDLRQHFSPLWLNNAGLDGHSTFGHLLLLRSLDARIRPDVALFLTGINEIGRDEANIFDIVIAPGLHFGSIKEFIKTLGNYSEVVSLGLNIYRSWMARDMQVAHNPHVPTPQDMVARFTLDRRRQILEAQAKSLAGYARRLQELIALTRKRGIMPVFMTQPALFGDQIDPTTHVDLARYPFQGMDGSTAWAVLQLYNDVTRRIAAKHQVPLIDLANEMPKDSAYYYDPAHYNNAGARKVSEIVARNLCPILAARFPGFLKHPCDAVPAAALHADQQRLTGSTRQLR